MAWDNVSVIDGSNDKNIKLTKQTSVLYNHSTCQK